MQNNPPVSVFHYRRIENDIYEIASRNTSPFKKHSIIGPIWNSADKQFSDRVVVSATEQLLDSFNSSSRPTKLHGVSGIEDIILMSGWQDCARAKRFSSDAWRVTQPYRKRAMCQESLVRSGVVSTKEEIVLLTRSLKASEPNSIREGCRWKWDLEIDLSCSEILGHILKDGRHVLVNSENERQKWKPHLSNDVAKLLWHSTINGETKRVGYHNEDVSKSNWLVMLSLTLESCQCVLKNPGHFLCISTASYLLRIHATK